MKKRMFLGLLMFLVLCSVAHAIDFPTIDAILMSQEPDPVKPGEVVEVRFKLENEGGQTYEDISVEILPSYPFTLYSGEPVVEIGKIGASQTGADAVIVKYKLKVDEKAVEGENEIELRVKVGDSAWKSYTNDEFMIQVETPDAILGIREVYTKPAVLVPGQDSKLYIKLKNEADSLFRNIRAKLDLSSADLPIIPLDSSNEKGLSQLERGGEAWIIFEIVAESDAESKIYKVPINLTYDDENGDSYSREGLIGLKVGDEPKLLIYVSETDIYSSKQKGTVTLTMANSGLTNIKLMTMALKPSEAYEILSAKEVYIGDVDSDDIESQEFELYINEIEDNSVMLPIELNYRDANNKLFSEEYNVGLKVYSGSEAKKFGLTDTSNAWIVIMIILAVAAYFGYRYWRKKKKKQ